VMHEDRCARFIGARDGVAIIRYLDDRHPLAVPLETLSLPAEKQNYAAPRATARPDARQAGSSPARPRMGIRAEVGRLPRRHPQRRPVVRP
jgi:hypothetical protein